MYKYTIVVTCIFEVEGGEPKIVVVSHKPISETFQCMVKHCPVWQDIINGGATDNLTIYCPA